ncbi:hypothetical protein D3248_01635 [Leucobacter zeae]|nr:hypothetical protein [Leucobacter zeae]
MNFFDTLVSYSESLIIMLTAIAGMLIVNPVTLLMVIGIVGFWIAYGLPNFIVAAAARRRRTDSGNRGEVI